MKKIIYWIALLGLFIFILIIYFINLIYLSNMPMYLFSMNTRVSFATWLFILIFLSMLCGAISVLFLWTFIKSKPKDIFEEDF